MPAYAGPFGPPPTLLQPGQNGYALGSFNQNQPTARFSVQKTGRTGGTATLNVTLLEGFAPAAGSLISVQGTTQGSGAFNVSNIALTAVSLDATTGVGTLQFVLAGTTASAADPGQAIVPVPEVGETLVNNQASQAFAIQSVAGANISGRAVNWSSTFPTAPSGVTLTLQGAMFDVDAQYATLDSSTSLSGSNRVIDGVNQRFLRVSVSGLTGSGTAVVKIAI